MLLNKSDLTIATITLARTPEEEKLLEQSLTALAALELPVFVTDGGSSPAFIEFLHYFKNFTVLRPEAKGVWPQAKSSVLAAHATGKPFILYTEPDKLNFFQDYLPTFIGHAPAKQNVGITLASRSTMGFNSFPAFQRTTETAINACIAEVTGKSFDFTYGPFILNSNLAPYLNQVTDDLGWGWRPYMFGLAHRLGFTLESYEADFACPTDQREDSPNERIYRMKQLSQNIQGLVFSTAVNISNPESN